jgi:molybdopterin converting factor small subunit
MASQATIEVSIKLFGFLSQLTEQAEVNMQVEAGSTVADVIHQLAERFGPNFRQALLDWHGNLQGGIEVVLNQRQISARRLSQISLQTDSVLVILPLVGGG